MKLKDNGMKRIYKSLYWTVPSSLFLVAILFYFGWLSFLFNVALGLTPMLYTGYLATQHENELFKRDKEFPAFIRALGATIFARQGGVLSSLEALQVHDFGSLQVIVDNLYTRLKIQSDKLKSWQYFAAESGSKLISRFSLIFSESIYLGGHARKIGELISSNFQRLIALRKLRYQQASALRGALYGSMVGFIVTVFISVSITEMLTKMFRASWEENVQQGGVSSMIASIIPPMPDLDPSLLSIYLGITIVMHAFMSALVIKVVDGGNKYAMLFDFIGMVWIGALMSWGVPVIADNLFAGSMGLG